ncbi:MAG: MerR family transcriptional regulator, light-induced transcriptional regulator [Actinomycetota bacterium]|nr:MerR family transcriptional regulator, light-induced transcriptional regulator [Actinomycetota bacterium]
MDLESAAAVLGVHYQTAYRWVRAGLLPAAQVGLGYELDPEDVEAVRQERHRRRSPRGGHQATDWWGEGTELVQSLLCGDEAEARQQLERLQAEGATPLALCEMLVAPALRRLDISRAAGLVLPAELVVAADLCQRLVGAMAAPLRGRPRGLAVVASPVGERHRLPSLMATAALRGCRWRVQHLGSDVPARDLIEFVEETLPDLVVLSVTMPTPDTDEFCEAVSTSTSVPVMTGGAGRSLGDLLSGIDQATAAATRPGLPALRGDGRVMAGRAPEARR